MRKLFDEMILVVVLACAGFVYLDLGPISTQIHNMVYGAPCTRPETYSIGQLDPRFKLSESDARAIIDRAAKAWNDASGKDLFEYQAQGGEVTINFTYDQRQAVTDTLSSLDSSLTQGNSAYNDLKAAYDSKKATLDTMKSDLAADEAAYSQELDAYNAQVRMWNARGGAPESARAELTAKQRALESDRAALQEKIDAVNAYVTEVNDAATALNAAAKSYNTSAASYNTISSQTAEFNEGEYIQSDGAKEIQIYQYSDMNKLVRVVEHELGHSLGLGHVLDKEAIMYAVNDGAPTAPTAADLTELQMVCSGQKQ